MRKNESEQVVAAFRDQFKVPLVAVDAEDRFLARLAGVTEPERKRKIIGEEFIRVFEEEAAKLGRHRATWSRARSTPDVIESGGGTGAATIKSHHNVGGLPEDLEFELVEPLRTLFKDEVRAGRRRARLARAARVAPALPGPGLAIRDRRRRGHARTASRSSATPTRSSQDEIRARRPVPRAVAVLLRAAGDLRTVGVQGDERTYGYVVVIRAVTSDDAMTADWARRPTTCWSGSPRG